jgi:ribulose-bisphosphate carboxylase large chain
MHVNGLDNKFSEDNDSVIESANSCVSPMFPGKPCIAMPVFSSGQTVMQPPETYRRLGSSDLIYTAGGGIMGHPGGPTSGVQALRDAWDAAIAGVSLDDFSKDHPDLAAALGTFRR